LAFSVERVFPPRSIEKMMKESSRNTICEMLRQTYQDILAEKYEDALYKLRIASTMAKRMSGKLKEYNKGYSSKTFFPGKDGKSSSEKSIQVAIRESSSQFDGDEWPFSDNVDEMMKKRA
jgi:hypothetical protein